MRKVLKLINDLIVSVFLFIFITLLSFSAYVLYSNNKEYESVNAAYEDLWRIKEEMQDEPPEIILEELRKINPDIKAWITISDT